MKEYKVVRAREKQAETVMNDMAGDGWEVVAVTYWAVSMCYVLITFVRER